MNTHDLLNEVIKLKRQSINDHIVQDTAMQIIAITKAFKLLQKLVSRPKYQNYYKQWLNKH